MITSLTLARTNLSEPERIRLQHFQITEFGNSLMNIFEKVVMGFKTKMPLVSTFLTRLSQPLLNTTIKNQSNSFLQTPVSRKEYISIV